MNPLSFLSQVTVAPVETKKAVVIRAKKQFQPETADLRIWNSGAIYPSNALIAEFDLEYRAKDAEDKGFGADIIDVRAMPSINTPQPFIALSFTKKDAGKVDIFGSVGYGEDGSPKVTVAEQGAATFGKETLLPLLKEVYDLEPNEEGFIDLNIVREMPFNSPNGIYLFPKTVSRGERKGEVSYVRRENQTVYALIPALVEESATEANSAVINHDDPFEDSEAVINGAEIAAE